MKKTIWHTINIYEDVGTGERIPEETAKAEYKIIIKHKTTTHNGNEINPKGLITITNTVRRNEYKQGTIW